MATSDDGKLNKALDAIAALPSAPAPAPASAEPVVNAAAMAALEAIADEHQRGNLNTAEEHILAERLHDLLDTFTVRELGGEVRDD